MLDEPLGALDRNLRERLVEDLRQILRRSQQTTVYVTHDQEEAFVMADRVVVMNAGMVEQVGTPQDIYLRPASLFVARFLGMSNFLPGCLLPLESGTLVETPFGHFPLAETLNPASHPISAEIPVTVLLRPDEIHIDSTLPCQVAATVQEVSFRGRMGRTTLLAQRYTLALELPFSEELPQVGAEIQVGFDPRQALQVFIE
jgi:ABC-type Fe3+/spermidine/putrescine transport system ATPase subunit